MSRARPVTLLMALVACGCLPPEWGANAILHPFRRPALGLRPDLAHREISFESDGITLKGWLFPARAGRRGLVVYLHGIADNRRSGVGVARRLVALGYDVLAYDSRAHGASEGTACTYGYYEKQDLRRALDALGSPEAVLFGSSLGAAVAIQAAAVEPRVRGVIAQSPFADLEAIVRERAPWFATTHDVTRALEAAERKGAFHVRDASPLLAATRLRVPVLLLHGSEDEETRPAHSRRLAEALGAQGTLLLVPGAGHNDVLGREESWRAIEAMLRRLGPASTD